MERAKRLPEAAPHCCAATSGRVISARKCAPSNSRHLDIYLGKVVLY